MFPTGGLFFLYFVYDVEQKFRSRRVFGDVAVIVFIDEFDISSTYEASHVSKQSVSS